MSEQSNDELLKKMDVVANAEDIQGPDDLSDLMDRATVQRDARLATDPEYNTQKYWHKSELVRGFAAGVIAGDPWYHGYQVPPNFEKVVNQIASDIDAVFGDVVVHASLQELREFFYKHAMAMPEFVAWNDTDGPELNFTSRYSQTPSARDFIDLDAALGQVICTLRNWKRDDERFDAEFEREHGQVE